MRRKHFSLKSAKRKKTLSGVKAGARKSTNAESIGRSDNKVGLEESYGRFQRLLVQARKKSGLSQQEVADRLGRPQTYVSKCELGTRRMDVVEFMEIAEVLGFDPSAFIDALRLGRNNNTPKDY
jgi:ribosome-binding protein aMBF1 (putative translation factor)